MQPDNSKGVCVWNGEEEYKGGGGCLLQEVVTRIPSCFYFCSCSSHMRNMTFFSLWLRRVFRKCNREFNGF